MSILAFVIVHNMAQACDTVLLRSKLLRKRSQYTIISRENLKYIQILH